MKTKKKSWIGALFAYAQGEEKRLGLSILLSVVSVSLGLVPFYCMYRMICLFTAGTVTAGAIVLWCLLSLGAYALKILLFSLSTGISHAMAYSILESLRLRLADRFLHAPLGEVEGHSIGEIKNMMVDKIENMEPPLAHMIPEGAGHLVLPIVSICALLCLNWRLALASLVTFPLSFLCMGLTFQISGDSFRQYDQSSNDMNSAIVEYIGGIEVIKAFNQGKQSYARFSDSVKANASYFYHWMKSCQMPVSLARAISPTTMITILPVGWLLYTGGSLPIETFITTIVLSLGIAGPLLAAMDFVDSLAKVGTIVGSVDAILNGAEQDHGEASVEFRGRDIKLSHVSFGYHADKEVLHDVSLTIPAGSMTAFVGPSGSGKSTIAKLIAGFWDVTSGSITLGGQDLKRVPLKQLYDQVAFVSQDNYLFDESIRENIRMGRPAATDAEVEAVAKAAGCDAFIRGLERGYDTVVGGGGAHLSGGERQRIAIARAMLKDAPIVVLDEATAYIDPENEAVVQQAVGKLVAGKTVLVIAHRLSTITGADQIVVVNGGRIQDAGTHEELLKNCPLYQEMWRAHMGAKEGEQA